MSRLTRTFHLISPLAIGLSIALAVLWTLGQPIGLAQAAPAPIGSAIRLLNSTAGITLVKTAPSVVSQTLGAGQTLLPYNFNIDNPSAYSIIPNAIVTDDLPNGLSLLGGTTGSGWSGIFPASSTAVTYTLLTTTTATSVDVGGYSAIVPVPARDGSILVNPSYCFSGNVNGTPQSFCESNPVTTTIRAPDFNLTENAIALICAGSYFTYTIVLTNPGGVRTSLPYTITGQITPVLSVVTGSISNGGLFTPNTITWTDSTNLLANGGSSITRTFSAFIPLSTPHGTPLTNTYIVTSPEVLPNVAVWQSSNVSVTKLTSAFTWTNTSAICVNNEVFFQNNSTGASNYQWDFGDGTPHSSLANPSHTYLTPGNYTVVLTATGACGTNVSTHTITVGALPSPSIAIAPNPTQLGITTTFTDTGSGGVSWLWNFGDGITSTVLTSSTFHIYTVTPGSYTVALTSTTAFGCFNATSQSLLVNPGAPYTITLTANPTQTLVGTKSLIGANATDQWGNAVLNGTNINFTAAPPPAFVVPTSDPTIGGFASTYVTSTLAGQTTVTGTAPNGAHGSTIVTFTVDAPYTVTLIASPLTLPVGTGSILTASVVDRYANPISNQAITFTTASNLGSGSIAPIVATSNLLGQANSIVTSTLPGVKTITASATSSVFGTANVTFTVGAPFTITLTANPTAQTVGNTSALSATVTDQFSNLISGVVISFTTGDNLGLGSISPATNTTDGSGTAHSAVMSTDANAKTIIGTTPNLISGTVVVTFVAGPPYRITLSAIPPTRTVGLSSNIRARVFDQYDNLVVGTVISFTTADPLGVGSLAPATSNTSVFGYADSFITSTLVGPKHVVATSSNLITASTVVTFFADVPYSLTLIALPTSLPVGNISALTATLTDQFSNPLSGFSTTLSTIDPLGGGTVTPVSGVTDVFGQMTSAISSTLPGVKTIAANTSGLTATAAVTFTTGAPFTITLIGLPSTLPVGNNSTLTATVTDKFANPISGDFVAFSSSALGSGGISPLGAATNGTGQSTSAISSTLVGPHVVQALEFGSGLTATTIITWTAGAATNLTLIANPTTLNVGSSSNLTATLTDAFSNPIAGSIITFTTLDPLGAGSLSSPATTDGFGNARSAITSTLVGVKSITATNGSLFASAQVTFTANAPVSITLIAIPNTLPVGSTSFLTATETDQYGNPIGSRFIAFSSNGNPPVPAGNTTNGSGQATSSITSPIAGTFVVTASDFLSPAIHGTALVTFTAGAPTQLLLIGIPANQSVGGTSSLSATLLDGFSNPLSGYTVNYVTTDPLGAGSINPASNTTGLNGVATSAISSTLSGVKTITATAGGLTATTQVTFAIGSPVSITLIALPNVLPVGSTSGLTATEVDQYSNPIVGRFISLASSGPTPAPAGGTTNGSGQVTSNLTSFSAGTFMVTATDFLSPTIFGTTLVTFTAGAPVTLTLIALPANQSVGNASLLTATLVDAFSNPIAGTVISFTTTDPLGSGSIAPASNTTGVNGAATSTITSTLSGVKTITATTGLLTATAQVTFSVGTLVSITVTPNPITVTVGSTQQFTATGYDQFNNPVPITPTWTTNGGSITASGFFTAQLTPAVGKIVTATQGSISGTAIVNIITGSLASIIVTPNPITLTVNAVQPFVATGYDAFSNTIPFTGSWTSSGGSIDASGVFTAPGAPINGLIITATQGLISGTAIVNVITACIPVSGTDFTYAPASPTTTSTVTFTGTVAAGTSPITYTWNFGDGSSIGLGNPTTHLYSIAGPYTIVMTATNGCGSASNSHPISVTGAGPVSATVFLPIILNNYPPLPQISFSLGGYFVLESAGSASITVVLTGSNGLTSTVDYATSDGTAIAPGDYASTSGTLVFPPGVTTQTFSVSIVNDMINEFPETVLLTLSNPSNAAIKPPATETLTIIDDDGGGVSCAPTVITTTASTYHPMGLAFDPVTMHLFVANRDGGGSLSVIDTLAVATTHVITGLNSAQGAAFDAGRNRIYVSGWDSVYVIDGSTYSVINTIMIGTVLTPTNSLAVAYNPTSDKIYVTGYDDNSITIINASTLSIIKRLTNSGSHPVKEPAYIAVNPVSNKVYIANHNGGLPTAWISVVDGSSNNVLATIYTGSGGTHGGDLFGITADTVHNLIYVNAIDVARVYVIDGATDMLTGDIQILRSSDLTPVPLRLSAVNPIAGPNTHLWLTSSSTEPRGLDRLIVLSGNWPSFGSPVATAVQPSAEGGLLFDPATWNVFASNNDSNLVTFSRDSLNLCPTPLAPASIDLMSVIHEYPHGRMGD